MNLKLKNNKQKMLVQILDVAINACYAYIFVNGVVNYQQFNEYEKNNFIIMFVIKLFKHL